MRDYKYIVVPRIIGEDMFELFVLDIGGILPQGIGGENDGNFN